MFNIFKRKRVSKVEKVIMGIYKDLYKNSTPQASFKKLVRNAVMNEDGLMEIPYDDYEIDADLYELIVETHIAKANLTPYEERGVLFQAYLGCGPRSVRKPYTHYEIFNLVHDWDTEHVMGFNPRELETVKAEVKSRALTFSEDRFNSSMMGHTCVSNDKGEVVTYHVDVFRALICAVEDRGLTVGEWD